MSETSSTVESWDKEIVPRRGLFSFPWRELWRYRDLIVLLAKRDLSALYKQTVLGPLWFVIQPLIATVAFSFLFGRLAGLGTSKIPHFLFYMGGLVPWYFFNDCVNKTTHTFTRGAGLFGKVYFPRLALPLASVLTNLAAFLVQFSVFLVGFGIYWWKMHYAPDPAHPIHLHPNWRVFLVPVMILQIAMLGMGTGLIVSSLTIRYRDLALATGFLVQIWMYASSVVFPLSRIPASFRSIMALNPMVPVIEGFRFAFLGQGSVTKAQFATSFGLCALILFIGLTLFNRSEQDAMDAV